VDELYFATLSLNERQASAIRPGQPAAITLRFYPDVPIVGTVERVVLRLERQADARFAAYLRLLETGDLALLPGMTGRAEIRIDIQ